MAGKQLVNTPLMDQYFSMKATYPEALLIMRVGDFYEAYGEDAVNAAKALGIVLTKRASGAAAEVELAGFPYHALDNYLPKLVRAGYKVAVCDQLEDPKFAKKIVKRGVTEVVTPGVSYQSQLLDASENTYLACLHQLPKEPNRGIAFLDISTGVFHVAQGSKEYIDSLLSRFRPKELLVSRDQRKEATQTYGASLCVSAIDAWAFVYEAALQKIKERFGVESLKGFGIEELPLAVAAIGATLFYLEQTGHTQTNHLGTISRVDKEEYLWIDQFTMRNLDLFPKVDRTNQGATLIDVIDYTSTPMGARLLRQWVAMPLQNLQALQERHDIVASLWEQKEKLDAWRESFARIGDVERLVSRAVIGRMNPREMEQLRIGVTQMGKIIRHEAAAFGPLLKSLPTCGDLVRLLQRALAPTPPAQFGKGPVIAPGRNAELDQLREITQNGREYLAKMQQELSLSTGIPSLKIDYNNVFGYYIEVRHTHKDRVPPQWIRKQTLVNAERYITEELKTFEEKVLSAQDRMLALEQQEYALLVEAIAAQVKPLQQLAGAFAKADCLLGFAFLAHKRNYCKPELLKEGPIAIVQGRHPVLETLMGPSEKYVPNNVYLNNDTQQIIIITGPNMAGKSALLRQTALIVLLAQIGSWVPAHSATIGLIDKLFTRVGAQDNLAQRESTFMVEMLESAAILNNVTNRSLVLFDEIGRGTSTYDGISIAWAIVEYLHEKRGAQAKTLFATHYHELNEMTNRYNRVKNFHISVKEHGNKVLFLRKLVEGGVAHSFGIHVAAMAGMPPRVVKTAQETLRQLEDRRQAPPSMENPRQLSFFQLEDPLLQDLRSQIEQININQLTPLEAFDALRELKRKIGQKV